MKENSLFIALRLFVVMTIITGIVYPAAITIAGRLAFPWQSSGSIMQSESTAIGSLLIAQPSAGPRYFAPRPSAGNYATVPSAASNLSAYVNGQLMGSLTADSLTNALNGYQRVAESPQADVTLRSEAKVGIAVTLMKWAEQKTGKEQKALLESALSNCVDVVYGTILRDGERLDPFWTEQAGRKAIALADSLQAWLQEVSLFQRLTNSVWPQLPAPLQRQAAKARENLEKEAANH